MKISSVGIVGGRIMEKYGKHGDQVSPGGIPTCSLPVLIKDPPEGTKTFALILEDKDAIPVCGFSWIHWCAANITRTELAENESVHAADFVQGRNSFFQENASDPASCAYGGMAPPDCPHTYELHVYALDRALNLNAGFYANELYWKMQGHILEKVTIRGVYKN